MSHMNSTVIHVTPKLDTHYVEISQWQLLLTASMNKHKIIDQRRQQRT